MQITFNTTARQDRGIAHMTERFNADQRAINPSADTLTPQQFLAMHVNHRIDAWVREFEDATRVSDGEAAKLALADPTDGPTIQAILDKYRQQAR